MGFKIEILSKSQIEKELKESQSNKPKEEKIYKPYIFEEVLKKQELGKGFKITKEDWVDEINSFRKLNGYSGKDYKVEGGEFKGPSIFMMKKSKEKRMVKDEEGNEVEKQFNTIKIDKWYNNQKEWIGWIIYRVDEEYIPPKKNDEDEDEEEEKKTKKKTTRRKKK